MPPAVPRYISAFLTDQGIVRPNNEDRVYCDDARGFFLVVDGMGGHEAGEHAAEIAVERVRARIERQTDSVEQRLREAITLANNAIYAAAQEKPQWNGMACVLTAAIVEDGQITVGHVGDSRFYRIKRGRIEKITHDHSPVGEREDSGELTEAAAMQHPRRNEVYRDVGSQERTPDDQEFIEILTIPFESDSAFLLCSDGLSDAISSERILNIVEQNAGHGWAAVRDLISAANETGKDNVSAVLIEGDEFAARGDARDAVGERTDRMTPVAAMTSAPWFRSGPAYVLYGALLGAVILFVIENFVLRVPVAPAAQVLRVAAPDTIGQALKKARSGDTVSVGPGTYTEAVTLKEGVELIADHAHEAVIQGSVRADGLQHARLEGFEIRAGEIGIGIHDSDVILARDDIGGARAAGVEFSGNSRGAIFACYIHNNAGAGIVLTGAAAPAIENNVVLDNGGQANSLRPGLFVRSTLRPSIAGNVFGENGAEAIWLPAADEAILQRNFFNPAGKADDRPKFRIIPLQEGQP
ncbi:MAG: protein phosphatase 2C domain-containing protein [Bryobacteraceae bacterium]